MYTYTQNKHACMHKPPHTKSESHFSWTVGSRSLQHTGWFCHIPFSLVPSLIACWSQPFCRLCLKRKRKKSNVTLCHNRCSTEMKTKKRERERKRNRHTQLSQQHPRGWSMQCKLIIIMINWRQCSNKQKVPGWLSPKQFQTIRTSQKQCAPKAHTVTAKSGPQSNV